MTTVALSQVETIARREAARTGRPHGVLNLNRAGAPLYVCREIQEGIEADRIVSRFDPAPSAPVVEPVASVVGEAPARARYAPVYNPAGTGGYDIVDRDTGSTDINGARHWFGDLHFAQKACDALNAGRPCPTMAEMCEAAPAMVPQPVQQQQARARGRAQQPARGERRYVTVRDTETGEVHRVLTSVARVGVAVVIFVPSNRHRQGALNGMLITHDDIRKAWVFNDEAEARRMLSRNRAQGERVIRAELVADPAPAIVPLGGRYVALADGGVEWVADAPTMVPQPVQQQQAKAGGEAPANLLPYLPCENEDQVERAVCRYTDRIDAFFMGGILDQAEYDQAMRRLDDWANRQYARFEAAR